MYGQCCHDIDKSELETETNILLKNIINRFLLPPRVEQKDSLSQALRIRLLNLNISR